jgi:hypothetical protein
MLHVHYQVVKHDTGWAYKLGEVFSETFASHEVALKAARDAATRQSIGGTTQVISFEDKDGVWHEEIASGGDRPDTDVIDAS